MLQLITFVTLIQNIYTKHNCYIPSQSVVTMRPTKGPKRLFVKKKKYTGCRSKKNSFIPNTYVALNKGHSVLKINLLETKKM